MMELGTIFNSLSAGDFLYIGYKDICTYLLSTFDFCYGNKTKRKVLTLLLRGGGNNELSYNKYISKSLLTHSCPLPNILHYASGPSS